MVMNATNGREGEGILREKKKREERETTSRHFTQTYANAVQRTHIVQLSNVYGYMQTLQFTILAYRYDRE